MEKDGRDGSYEHAERLSNPEKGVTGEGMISYQKAEKLGNKNVEDVDNFMADSKNADDSILTRDDDSVLKRKNDSSLKHEKDSRLKDEKHEKHEKGHLQNRAGAYKDTFITDKKEGIDEKEGIYEKAGDLAEKEKNIPTKGDAIYKNAEELGKETTQDIREFMTETSDETKKQTK